MTLSEIRALVQKLVASAQLPPAMACMRAYLSKAGDHPDLLNALLAIESRHSRNEQLYTIQRTIQLDDYQVENNSIVVGLLALVDEFPAESAIAVPEIEQLLLANNLTKKQVGKILYSIPSAMQVQVPVICTIRIAPEEVYEAVLRDGIDETNSTHVERLQRISEVMKVELREVGSGYFEIIPLTSDLEQIIYPNEYTEWLFQVTPLQTGMRTLTLEVSVVEILKEFGERRKSVKTLVRKIQVVTTEVEQTPVFEEGEQVDVAIAPRPVPRIEPQLVPAPELKPAITSATTATQTGGLQNPGMLRDLLDQQTTMAADTSIKPQTQPANGTKIMGTVTAIAVLVVGGWFFLRSPDVVPQPNPGDNPVAYNTLPAKNRDNTLPQDSLEVTPTDTHKQRLPVKDPFDGQYAHSSKPHHDPSASDVTTSGKTGNEPKVQLGTGRDQTLAKPGNASAVFAKVGDVPAPENENASAVLAVEFSLEIDNTGKITGHELIRTSLPALGAACERKITQLTYTPATQNGKSVPSTTRLLLTFRRTSPTEVAFVSAR